MKIFNSPNGDPMLLDTFQGMAEFRKEFKAFVSSSAQNMSFAADTTGNPEPYTEFLKGLRVHKSKGETTLTITKDKWLELLSGVNGLNELESQLDLEKDGDHNHFYSTPVSLIIEVNESWPGWNES